MSEIARLYREAIAEVRPDLAGATARLHARGWDSDAIEAGGTLFKFPKGPEAAGRLRLEARILTLIGPRVPLRVPKMRLHESPILFSEHEMIPGRSIEPDEYEALSPARKQAMGEALGGFYAALHAIPATEAAAIGVPPKPEWPGAAQVLPRLSMRLPAEMLEFAAKAFEAYERLPAEEPTFGYFDGHGWNMAFDHRRGVLNGVYDFADAGIGPRSREFTYSNLTSGDLTERIVATYRRLTGKPVDLRTVALRTAVQGLSELGAARSEIEPFRAGAQRWWRYMQARNELRLPIAGT
ncbi:MAG TPA: aminoglycoside phosphotransferase family protein [Devosia sp.]|nr:aminoglycoside phosphotransferase family protein [Devosia sp.]